MNGNRISNGARVPQKIQPRPEVDLRAYWNVFWKRKWLVIAFAAVVLASAALKTFTSTPAYTARGTILIEKEPNILSFEEIFQIETFNENFYQTQYKLLQSRSLAERVVERMKLYESVPARKNARNANNARPNSPAAPDPEMIKDLADSFLGRLKISPVRLTRLVEVSCTDGDPRRAAEGVNTLFEEFISMNIEAKSAATEQATEFLTNQIAGLNVEIAQKEKELQRYGAEKNIIVLSDKETTIVDKLSELNRALTGAQIERVNREAYYNQIKNASPDYIPEAIVNPLTARLREDYVKLSREYTKMQEKARPEYPEMQRLKTELESAKSLLDNETRNLVKEALFSYQAALKKEKSMQIVFDAQKEEAFRLKSNAIAYNSLKIEVENRKSLIESLLKRQSETGVSSRLKGLRTSNVRIVDGARVPRSPSSPNTKRNLLLGLFLGLFGGIGLAFFFEYLDNSVKTPEDVEKYAELPSLGSVPVFSPNGAGEGYGYGYGHGHERRHGHSRKKEKAAGGDGGGRDEAGEGKKGPAKEKRGLESEAPEKEKNGGSAEEKEKHKRPKSVELVCWLSPKSSVSETYRSIRTALLLSSAEPKIKTIVVSSALPSEGKTATISNLAVTMAQAGKRVLIVDSDLRKPRQHRIFGLKNVVGLTNYLTEDLDMTELIKSTPVPNLFLVNSGPVPPNPAELLGSEKMFHFIDVSKKAFDYVFFDTPPLLAVTDALVMAPKIDGVLLVVWGGHTPHEALKGAKEKLDLMNIKSFGVVINRLKKREHDYYYKHYYYHYYGES